MWDCPFVSDRTGAPLISTIILPWPLWITRVPFVTLPFPPPPSSPPPPPPPFPPRCSGTIIDNLGNLRGMGRGVFFSGRIFSYGVLCSQVVEMIGVGSCISVATLSLSVFYLSKNVPLPDMRSRIADDLESSCFICGIQRWVLPRHLLW